MDDTEIKRKSGKIKIRVSQSEKTSVLKKVDDPSLLSLCLSRSTRLENEVWCMRVPFSARREVQPPTTDLLADWINGWGQWLGGGRRRTGSALAIPAGAALGFV